MSFNNRMVFLRLLGPGSTRMNQDRIADQDVPGQLHAIYGQRAERMLYVTAGDEVPYGTVAEAIGSS